MIKSVRFLFPFLSFYISSFTLLFSLFFSISITFKHLFRSVENKFIVLNGKENLFMSSEKAELFDFNFFFTQSTLTAAVFSWNLRSGSPIILSEKNNLERS
jgi:hypothetical protein